MGDGIPAAVMKDKLIVGALLCLIAGVTWGAQFPIAGSALKFIDPFYFTLLRYLAVTLILVLLLIIAEGPRALTFDGRATWVWFYGTMAFTVYNFLVFLGQTMAGPSGAILASIMMALMPIISVLVIWVSKKTTPGKFTVVCIVTAFLGVSLVITKGDSSTLSLSSGNLVPGLLILTGVLAWVIYTVGGSNFAWSPLRYTTLSCMLGTGSALVTVVAATIAGYLRVPAFDSLATIRWEMTYMIVVSGVLAIFSWNAGNRALAPINGILFINLVPVTTFIISAATGYRVSKPEIMGAVVTIVALVSNNLYQRGILGGKRDDRRSTIQERFDAINDRFDRLEVVLADQTRRIERLEAHIKDAAR
jgi:drug/metabolite transporter (DMT)-like permease